MFTKETLENSRQSCRFLMFFTSLFLHLYDKRGERGENYDFCREF